jgi:hypothetical protein
MKFTPSGGLDEYGGEGWGSDQIGWALDIAEIL